VKSLGEWCTLSLASGCMVGVLRRLLGLRYDGSKEIGHGSRFIEAIFLT
jgi:hypothetical protein